MSCLVLHVTQISLQTTVSPSIRFYVREKLSGRYLLNHFAHSFQICCVNISWIGTVPFTALFHCDLDIDLWPWLKKQLKSSLQWGTMDCLTILHLVIYRIYRGTLQKYGSKNVQFKILTLLTVISYSVSYKMKKKCITYRFKHILNIWFKLYLPQEMLGVCLT